MNLKMRVSRLLLVGVCLLQIQCTTQVDTTKHDSEITPFFGTYAGTSINVAKGEISERDLAVVIQPWDENGFNIEWTAVTYRSDGTQKRNETSINFFPSPRAGIFASAMKKNVFGHTVSYDPVGEDGAPFVWAGLADKTLTVRALYIVDSGDYEIHTYKRTLQEGGLALDFDRIRNGEKVTEVQAMLGPSS
ncbi:MAG: hypothetical protein AB8B64_05570 [Granulosicoccus sp.]